MAIVQIDASRRMGFLIGTQRDGYPSRIPHSHCHESSRRKESPLRHRRPGLSDRVFASESLSTSTFSALWSSGQASLKSPSVESVEWPFCIMLAPARIARVSSRRHRRAAGRAPLGIVDGGGRAIGERGSGDRPVPIRCQFHLKRATSARSTAAGTRFHRHKS